MSGLAGTLTGNGRFESSRMARMSISIVLGEYFKCVAGFFPKVRSISCVRDKSWRADCWVAASCVSSLTTQLR